MPILHRGELTCQCGVSWAGGVQQVLLIDASVNMATPAAGAVPGGGPRATNSHPAQRTWGGTVA